MMRFLARTIGALVLSGLLTLTSFAQTPSKQQPGQSNAPEVRVPAPEYALAFLGSVLVLLIVCMPSRKA